MNPESASPRKSLSKSALLLAVCIAIFIWVLVFSAANQALKSGTGTLDFSQQYVAGGLIVEGHRALLFNLPAQAEYQHRVIGMSGVLPFMHLAYESLLFIPLALLPYGVALWIWRALSLGLLLLSARMLADTFNVFRLHACCLAFALFPVAVAIAQGQDSLLMLFLLTSSLVCLNRDQDRTAGFVLALALFKPQLILAMACILVWRRGARFLVGFGAGTAVVLALSTAVTGWQGWRTMTSLWRYAASGSGDQIGDHPNMMSNLRGLTTLLGRNPHIAVLASAVLSALLFVFLAWKVRRQRSAYFLFPPLIALALLASPNLNVHDVSPLIVPALALFVADGKMMKFGAAACFTMPLFLAAGYVQLFCLPILLVLYLTADVASRTGQKSEPARLCV